MTLPITSEDMLMKIKAANSVGDLLKLPIPNFNQSDQMAIYTVHSIPGEELEDAYDLSKWPWLMTSPPASPAFFSQRSLRSKIHSEAQQILYA